MTSIWMPLLDGVSSAIRLKTLDDDSVLLTATVKNTSELHWCLLGFGDKLEVKAPKSLREEFKSLTSNMSRRYQSI